MPLIELAGAGRAFDTNSGPVRVLKDISFTIDSGEFVCLTGPSGAGKSTLLNIIGCLDRPSEGNYRFAGRDVGGLGDRELAMLRRLAFGFVFQDYGLLDRMTALRNVELPAEYAGIPGQDRSRQAEDLLRSFGVEGRMTHLPAELSGGEQQRVAIARALMNGRRIILADEPTGALDSRNGEQILSLFRELASRGHTVVMVSHDAAVAGAAERRIELFDGAILRDSGARREPSEPAYNTPALREKKQSFLSHMTQALRAGVDSLRAARLHTALQAGGPLLGVASAIALLGLANGTYQASLMVVGNMGADTVGVAQIPQPGFTALGTDDARSIEGLDNVREVASAQSGMKIVRYEEKVLQVFVDATQELPEFMRLQWPLADGGYITRQDGDEMSQVVVIGPRLRTELFLPHQDPLGDWIEIGGLPFEIKGVLAPHPIMEGEPYRSRPPLPPSAWVPFATGREMLFGSDIPMSINAYVHDVERLDETATDLRDLLIGRLGHENFYVSMDRDIFGVYRDSIRTRVTLLVGIAVPALLTGAAITMALMLGAIRQRAREIAIRMAVGARRSDISRQFIAETCLVTLLGIAIGVPLGFIAGHLVELVLDAPSAYESWYIWAAIAVALASALLSGILPARRAATLDPVAALELE